MLKANKPLSKKECAMIASAIIGLAGEKFVSTNGNKQAVEVMIFAALRQAMQGIADAADGGDVPEVDTSKYPIEFVTAFGMAIEEYVSATSRAGDIVSALAKVYEGQVFATDEKPAVYKECLFTILKAAGKARVQTFATNMARKTMEGKDIEEIPSALQALKIPDDLMEDFRNIIEEDEESI